MSEKKDFYSAGDVFHLLGIQFRPVKNALVPCPKCGRKKFYMNLEKNTGCCKAASCGFKGNQISYYALSRGLSNKEAHEEIMAYLGSGTVLTQEYHFEDISTLPLPELDKAYRALKELLPLSNKHVELLKQRGLKKEEMTLLGYLSYDFKDGKKIARELQKQGISLAGVSGFFIYEDEWTLKYGKRGIMVPYLSKDGLIQGYQIRKDHLIRFKNGKLENKYKWLSSSGLKDGAAAHGYIHWAVDRYYDLSAHRLVPRLSDVLYVTEGSLKGDIIHLLTGIPVIAVPGVDSLNDLFIEFSYLRENGVKKIVNVYDMDYVRNENVQAAQSKLEIAIKDNGFEYDRLTWEEDIGPMYESLKGYDDFLMYHYRGIKKLKEANK